ncbi:Uncharacterized protein ToN1_49850 [Aromatoleum petrolei]|nr:Uncharacterized protein ToN1_49850 [Aromatoleum petrolei]
MEITTIGVDLAKSVFQVHGVDRYGKTVLRKQLKRDQVANFMARQRLCRSESPNVRLQACPLTIIT